MKVRSGPWLPLLLLLAVAAGLAGPVLAFLAGRQLIGPYEAPLGLRDYLSHIFADAAAGHPAAWVLLLAPALVLLVWWVVVRLWPAGRASRPAPPSQKPSRVRVSPTLSEP